MLKPIWFALVLGLGQANAVWAVGLPTDFSDKVEAALLCRSEWSTSWWQYYFNANLGPPLRSWGNADWYKSLNAQLGGVTSSEVFVNSNDSTALFVGAILPSKVEEARKQIEEALKISFSEVNAEDGVRYMTRTGSVLVGLTNNQTKWYCARWQLGNRP